MSLNAGEGIRRVAVALRVLGHVWGWGWAAVGVVALFTDGSDRAIVFGAAVALGLAGFGALRGLAWLVEGWLPKPPPAA